MIARIAVLRVQPSLELIELARGIARKVNDGTLAALPTVHRERLREMANELACMSSDEQDREEAELRCDRQARKGVLATLGLVSGA